MKKALLILLMFTTLTSVAQTLLLTEDTYIDHDENYDFVRTNGYNLTVNGSLNVQYNIILTKGNQSTGGSVHTTGDLIVNSNIFFFEDNGLVRSNTGISIGNEALGTGTLSYCSFLFPGNGIASTINVIQDCTLSVPKADFNFEKATPLYYINVLGQRQYNIDYATGLFITVYELKGRQASRKELYKQGIKIN